MARFMNVIAIFVVMGSIVRGDKEQQIDKDENIEPFSLLFRIYNVATDPPINHVDLQEADKIVQEIDALNTSLMEPKWVNKTEKLGSGVSAQINPTTTREPAVFQLSLTQISQRAHKILDGINKVIITENIEKAKAEFNKVIFGGMGMKIICSWLR
ncbi:unnamed protein product [Trypanosoma congolense IL3000]|uniref:WGS project CAEQ00000000 data, annotated contig 731 n=1 Tax=Trypanosoma congolense (strain IL3000) TaxID=1068625 RepID=F9WI45_TRYCI|nr:unnamed protein product [Trypanosoma congolense IL3000]